MLHELLRVASEVVICYALYFIVGIVLLCAWWASEGGFEIGETKEVSSAETRNEGTGAASGAPR